MTPMSSAFLNIFFTAAGLEVKCLTSFCVGTVYITKPN